EGEHGAELGAVEFGLQAGQPLVAKAVEVNPVLPVDGVGSRGSRALHRVLLCCDAEYLAERRKVQLNVTGGAARLQWPTRGVISAPDGFSGEAGGDDMPDSLGARLREARTSRGLSLRSVAQ